jgi:hypothetical protein
MSHEREHQPQPNAAEAAPETAVSAPASGRVQFSARGVIPAVGSGVTSPTPTASERVYGGGLQMKPKESLPKGDEGFKELYDQHPHNYQDDDSKNTDSPTVLDENGLPAEYENTCAIRISIMLNGIGQHITPAKVKAAGIKRPPHYSKKTKQFYLLAASEIWTYISNHYRKADMEFPKKGRFKDDEEFQKAFESEIKPAVQGKHGIVAFDKIFTYSGSGHMDLFDGEKLSDSPMWYPSQRVELWFI